MNKFIMLSFWAILMCAFTGCNTLTELRVLQFNIWQEGTQVPKGYDAILDEIIASKADLICLSEVRNYKGSSLDQRLVKDLKKRGFVFYSLRSQDTGILSRYPIKGQWPLFPVKDDRGSVTKALIDVNGSEVVLYSAHLDYRNCALYLPRGYDGSTWKELPGVVTDVQLIQKDNLTSMRDEAIAAVIEDAKMEREKGRMIFLGGDFNEPSHLDWIDSTKNLFDHNGVVYAWDNTLSLYKAGLVDCYREKFPNPVTHPGFTFPADNPLVDIKRLAWSPKADDRDRIDFVFYYPDARLKLNKVAIIGPRGSVCRNKRIIENSKDIFVAPQGIWPTDHKAVLATFSLRK